jgi:hypothetical protein
VVAVNREAGIALTDRDRVIRLTDFIGPDGERCHEDDAVCAVGFAEDAESEWWSINLVNFKAEPTQ